MNGTLIKQKLFELNWRIERLASEVGVSTTTIGKMIAGKRVSERTVFRTAEALKLKVTDLELQDEVVVPAAVTTHKVTRRALAK